MIKYKSYLNFIAREKVYVTMSFSRLSSRTLFEKLCFLACLPMKKGRDSFFYFLNISSGFNVTSSGSIYLELSLSISSGYFSLVNSYGVLPPKISLGILFILSSIPFTCSSVKSSNDVDFGK